jgi:hypothetical protein
MNKAELKYIQGDVTDVTGEDNIVIAHVCNNQGRMGAGVALALASKWPEVKRGYQETIQSLLPARRLGYVSWCYDVGDTSLVVANMIAQKGFRSPHNPKPLRYAALVQCMIEVRDRILSWNDIKKDEGNWIIHAPKFGSLRSGGSWKLIEELIKEIWVDSGIDVVIYEFKE